MYDFAKFEIEVIGILLANVFSSEKTKEIINESEFVSYEYTGYGYFLTLRHAALPEKRTVCSKPFLIGEANGIRCGFVIFLEHKEMTLECHSWGEKDVPENFRKMNVQVKTEDVQGFDSRNKS